MRRLVLSLALAAGACAPAPPTMPATDAIELLEQFAVGAASIDVCTAEGRAVLRGAVRSYSSAMRAAGVPWPALPEGELSPNVVDLSVVMAMLSGFVEPSDLQGRAGALTSAMLLNELPRVTDFRRAAQVACRELLQLQQGAARYAVEAQRLERLIARAKSAGGSRVSERARRQNDRLNQTLAHMHALAEQIERRVDESRRAG